VDTPRTFLEILQRLWWRLDRALDEQSIRASALVAARDALLCGTTTLVDHHASPNAIDGSLDIIAGAFRQVGVRSVLAYEVSDRDGADRARAGLAENERFMRSSTWLRCSLSRPMVGAHASFTLSDATLEACVGVAADSGHGLHIHAGEDAIDTGAIRRLAAAKALNSKLLVAHAVHVDEEEARAIADHGVAVAHNARSNMNNGVGHASLDRLGEGVMLGTDGIGSDMWAEASAAYFRQREEQVDAGPDLGAATLAHGAAFVGRLFDEPDFGTISVGAPADLVVLDYSPPTVLDATNLAAHLVYGMSSANVSDVVVAGEIVVRDGMLTRVDQLEIDHLARRQARALWERVAETPVHTFERAD
jgi:cytosine/adenosine deaminase-related metal-dependent hydrolase